MRKAISIVVFLAFIANSINAPIYGFELPAKGASQSFAVLSDPGVLVRLSPEFKPPVLKGIKVHPENPFLLEFILEKGDRKLNNSQIKDESTKLIKYFLASLTIPEKDLWVNLSPYEKDRVIPNSFGLTEMGRDLLAEDYMLKQITASLIYPEDAVGKRFWKRIYEEAYKKYGTTNIPVNTFNKVWIVPEKAVVYENGRAGTAYVLESKLKVMLQEDYLAMAKHGANGQKQNTTNTASIDRFPLTINQLGSQIVREIILPELSKEVNYNRNFALLRQVYNSLILATWYKMKIKSSILSMVYSDKNKVTGIKINDPKEKDRIYHQYLEAFKKGVYSYIKEEVRRDPQNKMWEIYPRKYFSGGFGFIKLDRSMTVVDHAPDFAMTGDYERIEAKLNIADEALVVSIVQVIAEVVKEGWPELKDDKRDAQIKYLKDLLLSAADKKKFLDNLNKFCPQGTLTKSIEANLAKSNLLNGLNSFTLGIFGGAALVSFRNESIKDSKIKMYESTSNFDIQKAFMDAVDTAKFFKSYPGFEPEHIKWLSGLFLKHSGQNKMFDVFKDSAMMVEQKELVSAVDEEIDTFIKLYDPEHRSLLLDLLTRFKRESVSLESFRKDLVKISHILGKSDPGKNIFLFDQIFTAWEAKIASHRLPKPKNLERLNNLSLQSDLKSLIKPHRILFIRPQEKDIDLMQEWLNFPLVLNPEVQFWSDWKDLIKNHQNILAIVSTDNEGKRHLEGWIAYDIYPVFGLYIHRVEIAPWHRKKINGLKWKGVGSLLVAKVINESLRLGYEGRVFAIDATTDGTYFFKFLGAIRDPGIEIENYFIVRPFYYFDPASGQEVIKTQNRMKGDLIVEDHAMNARKTNTGGIDLTTPGLNLKTQIAGDAIKFQMDPKKLFQLQNAAGLVPMIINIQPIGDLKEFLGVG